MKRVLVALLAKADQPAAQFRGDQLVQRQDHVADGEQLVLGQQALGRAGAAGDEDRLPSARRRRVPAEVGRRRRRRVVLVQADEGRIDGEAREAEIVQIAAEGRGAVLRREGEADVGVVAVGVELELAAPVQGDDLAALGRVAAAGFALDPAGLGVAGLGEGLAGQARRRPPASRSVTSVMSVRISAVRPGISRSSSRLRGVKPVSA